MKKMFTAVLVVGLSFGAIAQQDGSVPLDGQGYAQGGFKDSTSGRYSVAQAKALSDNAWVILEGSIIKQIEHERYEFRDSTGSIHVEIDDELWLGQSAVPNDKVRIEGEVDNDWNRVEIDVKSLRVLK